jgi:hypothetical protein
MSRRAKKKPEASAALDRIAAALDGLPASRRGTIEKELLARDLQRLHARAEA